MARNQFTVYRSFWEAAKELEKEQRRDFLEAVLAYVFDREKPTLTGPAASSFILVKPILDKGEKLAKNGAKGKGIAKGEGKSKAKADGKQTQSKSKANGKQMQSEKEGEKEIENDSSPPFIPPEGGHGFGAELNAALADWLRYKAERGQKYKPTGLMALVEEVRRHAQEHGETAVAAVLRLCMANGWAGIAWDKVAGEPAAKAQGEQEDVSWMKAYL